MGILADPEATEGDKAEAKGLLLAEPSREAADFAAITLDQNIVWMWIYRVLRREDPFAGDPWERSELGKALARLSAAYPVPPMIAPTTKYDDTAKPE